MDRNEKMLPASLHSGDPGDQCSKQCCGPERSQKKIIIIILKKKAKDQMFSCPKKKNKIETKQFKNEKCPDSNGFTI